MNLMRGVPRPARGGLLLAVALGLGLSAALRAHDTWLLPERFEVAVGKTLNIEMTSGMHFPRLESPIERTRVARAEARLGGSSVALTERRSQTHALAFLHPFRAAGIATLAVELKPRTLELRPAQVKEYLDEIGATPEVRRAWAASPGKAWVETYTKHAKTFLRVGKAGEASRDLSWREAVGFALELVPDADPTAIAAGQRLTVTLLRDGKPLPGLAVGVVRENAAAGTLQTTDAEGRATLSFGKRGLYLVRATYLRPEGSSGDRWVSDFTTLTLEAH